MHRTTEKVSQASAIDFARRIVPFWQAALGSELLGAYLIGSLAHGGFSRRYSDVDMALVTEAGVSAQTLDRVRSEAAALSAPKTDGEHSALTSVCRGGVGCYCICADEELTGAISTKRGRKEVHIRHCAGSFQRCAMLPSVRSDHFVHVSYSYVRRTLACSTVYVRSRLS